MATPESKTKARVKRILEEAGVYFFMPPANGYGRAGIPDVIACVNGFFLAIECKAGKGTTTALQERELQRIQAARGIARVIYDREADYAALTVLIAALKQRKPNEQMD